MIVGIGLDIADINRFGRASHPRLAERILTPRERELTTGNESRRQEFLAGRFAVKEATAKAFGTGIGKRMGWHDIEVLPGEVGRPNLVLSQSVLARIGWEDVRFHVSITHSRDLVAAQVIVERT